MTVVPPLSAGVTITSLLFIRLRNSMNWVLVVLLGLFIEGMMEYGTFKILQKSSRLSLDINSIGGRQVDLGLNCLNSLRL